MTDMRNLAAYNIGRDGISIENFMTEREPRGQLLIAAEYIVAAFVLDENHSDFPVPWSAYMLACHAIELSLKAALQLSGVNAQDLKRKPLNHDLSKLLERCIALPEFTLESNHREIIDKVAPAMGAFTFRYGLSDAGSDANPAKLHLPPLILVIAAANKARETSWRLL